MSTLPDPPAKHGCINAARSGRRFAFGILPVAILMIPACTSTRDAFEQQRRQAVVDSHTREARAYTQQLSSAVGPDLANLMQKCTRDFPDAGVDTFELVLKVDHWGEPKAILVKPLTGLSQCVAEGFWYFTLPRPGPRFEKHGVVILLPIRIT